MSDEDTTAEPLAQASEWLRSALHKQDAPQEPAGLYDRAGGLVELLGRLRQVAGMLGEQVANLAANERGLASNDATYAAEHAERAGQHLRDVAEDLAAAGVAADLAHNALSHLKIDG
jgi:hypothetical protein